MRSEDRQSTPLLGDVVTVGATTIVRFVGEIDLGSAPHAERLLRDAVEQNRARRLVVDLAEVPFCDSSGLALLARVAESARADDVDFRLRRPRPILQRLIDVTNLAELLPLDDDT